MLYLLDICGGTEIGCDDAFFDRGGEALEVELLAGQTVIAVVEGYHEERGDFELKVFTPGPEDCADQVDNDLNGYADCYDQVCVGAPTCVEICGDGIDDDGDYQADCADPDCDPDPDCAEDCNDGLDDDDDGLIDCFDSVCALEPACPEDCDNGADDDGDDDQDCADLGCASVPACASICPEETLAGSLPITLAGSTTGRNDDQAVSCGDGIGDGPDWTVGFTAPDDATYIFDTAGSAFDTVLAIDDGCGGVELACGDATTGPGRRSWCSTRI